VIIQVNPVSDYYVRQLCCKPYPGHPKGCPNFNHKEGCPPSADLFDHIYDLSKPVYAIVNIFDFKAHTDRMRELHPSWSERQVRCCLYWQAGARKQLLIKIKDFLRSHRGYSIETCPEAMGVNVTETMKKAGLILEWPPETVAFQIALAGIKK
jgi:predicted metal-binding protein